MTANIRAAVMAAVVALLLSACGGGGGGGDPSPAPTAVPVAAAGPTCPNGSPIPATGSSACPAVGVATGNTLQDGSVVSPSVTPLAVSFNGGLSSAAVVLWQGAVGGTSIDGTTALSGSGPAVNSGNIVTFAPTVRLAFGQPFVLVITAKDTLGRNVSVIITFTTPAMSCTNSAIWSNPAVFAVVLQDCVAGVGIQAFITPFNTLQDNSCTLTNGAPLSAACKAYLANGTFLLAATSMVVNSHTAIWMAYIGLDGKSNIVLFDANDLTAMIPVGTMVLPVPLVWVIGNPTGESIAINTGVAGNETDLVTWDATTSTLKRICLVRCPAP